MHGIGRLEQNTEMCYGLCIFN